MPSLVPPASAYHRYFKHRAHRPQALLSGSRGKGKALLSIPQRRRGALRMAGRRPSMGASGPTNFVHKIHVGFDPVTGAFTMRVHLSNPTSTPTHPPSGHARSMCQIDLTSQRKTMPETHKPCLTSSSFTPTIKNGLPLLTSLRRLSSLFSRSKRCKFNVTESLSRQR